MMDERWNSKECLMQSSAFTLKEVFLHSGEAPLFCSTCCFSGTQHWGHSSKSEMMDLTIILCFMNYTFLSSVKHVRALHSTNDIMGQVRTDAALKTDLFSYDTTHYTSLSRTRLLDSIVRSSSTLRLLPEAWPPLPLPNWAPIGWFIPPFMNWSGG